MTENRGASSTCATGLNLSAASEQVASDRRARRHAASQAATQPDLLDPNVAEPVLQPLKCFNVIVLVFLLGALLSVTVFYVFYIFIFIHHIGRIMNKIETT